MTLPLKGLFAALATVTIWALFLVGTRFAVSTNFTVEEVLLLRLGTGFLITIPLMLKLGVVPYGQSVTGAIMLGLGASALFPYIISMGLLMSALKYDPNCSGSKAYLSLAKEVAKKTMES